MAINVERLLADALVELCKEKPLRKITITDIISKAGTGRQTFYNHFRDKNDLVYWVFLHTLAGERKLVRTQGYFFYLVKLLREAQKISPFLMQACKLPGQNSLSEAIHRQNYQYYKNFIVNSAGKQSITPAVEYALRFNAAGATDAYISWVIAGTPGSAEDEARLLLSCMPKCMQDLLPLHMEAKTS